MSDEDELKNDPSGEYGLMASGRECEIIQSAAEQIRQNNFMRLRLGLEYQRDIVS